MEGSTEKDSEKSAEGIVSVEKRRRPELNKSSKRRAWSRQARSSRKEMNDQKTDISHEGSGEGSTGPAPHEERQKFAAPAKACNLAIDLMEKICDRANLNRAYKRVKQNGGSAGIDGMKVDELSTWIVGHKEELILNLLNGRYRPQSVRKVEIPKPGGGIRQLGIPTVVDRLVQQAILQVMSPIIDPKFSESSFGFRAGRSAHQALRQSRAYVSEGYAVVVDIDLEKFFDRVNHDKLMARLSRHIGDKRVLRIIRRYLEAGIMQDGVVIGRHEGTPQGGPLSPLLANVLLDDLDKELEKRGHKFCRYADDCNIYVRTERAGERVMTSIKQFLERRLKLKVNNQKSAVAPVGERKFLGYRLRAEGVLTIAPESLKRVKDKIRSLTKRNRGVNLETIVEQLNTSLAGWVQYFRLTEWKSQLLELDAWIRRKLRCYRLKQRKRAWSIAKYLMSLGVRAQSAWALAKSGEGWWRLSAYPAIHEAMNNAWFDQLGLMNLTQRYRLLNT